MQNWSFPSSQHRDSAIAEAMIMYPDAELTACGEFGIVLRFVGALYDLLVGTLLKVFGGILT